MVTTTSRQQVTKTEFNPLREFGLGPAVLFAYALMLITLKFLLVGLGKKSAVSC